MDIRSYYRNFSLSAAGLACLGSSLAAAFAAGIAWNVAAGAVAGIGAYALLVALLTLSGVGPKAAVREGERRNWRAMEAELEAARKLSVRLGSLRVPDKDIQTLVSLCALRARTYMDACLRARSIDPRALDAVRDCLETTGIYLRELDDGATERRFGLEDNDPFAGAKERVSAALADRAAVLEKALLDLGSGIEREDEMTIRESL